MEAWESRETKVMVAGESCSFTAGGWREEEQSERRKWAE